MTGACSRRWPTRPAATTKASASSARAPAAAATERTIPTLNPRLAGFACSLTGAPHEAPLERPVGLCRCCAPPGRPLVAIYAGEPGPPTGRGLWRHGARLPVVDVPAGYADDVGDTATIPLDLDLDLVLSAKLEGGNPTGSFKDRGLAVGVALGVALGARRFCLPTQGNAGVAAAFFSQRLGLPGCLVYMPDGYQGSVYHRSAELFGAEVRFAGANIAGSGKVLRETFADDLTSGALVDLSTFFEPGRLEGKKTLGLEIAEGPLPDAIVYPTGGGTGLVGIWRAFEELALPDAPRMYAVQSERCAPVVAAFARGDAQVSPVTSAGTIADGLDVPGAIMGHEILRALRDSGGGAVAVSEAAIADDWRALNAAGVPGGYEGAATLAAARSLRASGHLAPGERVLLLVTSGPTAAIARAIECTARTPTGTPSGDQP